MAINVKQSVVTVGRNGLSFNVETADVLHRASFVQVLLNAEARLLAVQATPYLDIQSTRFFRPEVFKTNRIKINSRSMVKKILETAGLAEGETWNIAGIYSAENDAIIYDLTSACKPSSRGGWATGRRARCR